MKKSIEHSELLSNSNFVLWFLMTNFPEGIDDTNDYSLSDMIQEKCILDEEWIDGWIGYYDGVFDENDGYVDTPNTVKLKLATRDVFSLEFHPGDTIYYINDEVIGCTGPHYGIRKISLTRFCEYTCDMNEKDKLFLLPMLKISFGERDKFINLIRSILCELSLQGCSVEDVITCILENCLE